MSLLRRRMMMKTKKQQSSIEDLDYFTVVASYEDMEVSLYPAVKYRVVEIEILPGLFEEEYYSTPLPFSYSIDGSEWINVTGGVEVEGDVPDVTKVSLNKGSRLRIKTDSTEIAYNTDLGAGFVVLPSTQYDVDGTIMSLIFCDDFEGKNYIPHQYCVPRFMNMPYENTNNKIVRILRPDIFLPATELCDFCYEGMFYGCTSLVNAPKLPATELTQTCYRSMFEGCTGLITAPELPATTLATYCYYAMFYGCTNLNYIKMLGTDISAERCLDIWVTGVSPTGTFVKSKDATWFSGVVPTGWTVITDEEESEGGGSEVKLISFIIYDTQYQAEEGMIWGEWVNSKYNTDGYYIDFDDSISNQSGSAWIGTSEDYVFSQDIIIEGYKYSLVR